MNFRITLGLGLMILSGVWNQSQGQQLREAFRKVEEAVVIVRTAQKELPIVDGNLAKALNLPQPAGVLVQRVAEGSLAWRWGIHAGTQRANVEGQELILGGDIILGVNDVPVEEGGGSCGDIYASILKLKPGDNLVIKLFRRGQIVKLSFPVP